MLTIRTDTANALPFFADALALSDEVRISMVKPDAAVGKIFVPTVATANSITRLTFTEVAADDEDLDAGEVTLRPRYGEWVLEVQTKATLDTDWLTIYSELATVKNPETPHQFIGDEAADVDFGDDNNTFVEPDGFYDFGYDG
jgi:hypothetical protein